MFRKLVTSVLIIAVLAAAFAGWLFFTANTAFNQKSKYLYIRTGHATWPEVLKTFRDSNLVKSPAALDLLATRLGVPEKLKAGRYEIKQGMSLMDISRLLRNGTQAPVKLIITKLRTKENLAGFLGRKMEVDSADVIAWMTNPDTLQPYGFDSNTVMAMIYPNTYTYFWNASIHTIFNKFYNEYKKVWTDARREQARKQGLTPAMAYTLASIVEEETNDLEEKDTIASVYLNRLRKGMRLQADPTIKFAMKDFTLKRIYLKYLTVESPYNTYMNTGLPPGPICTPSLQTLDAVLQSPQTNYLYFVAKSDFSGRHVYTETYDQHLKVAKEFQKALDIEQQKRAAAQQDLESPE
ncbi:endolytic transglycosylase MltG [Longitalea luteola]|uniref:endolytic transglycosylase MltG n=1 Tax=Longitalea luteola TaxID=2812563 RepID=UPI001A97AA6B|nr:endolytic transglycosylase MltG [Longitalea luteola]